MTLLSDKLLDWYKVQGRDLPWRIKGGAHPDPYAVWISEIMLQQTTVKTVLEYFPRWMARFPNIETLAKADIQDVLLMWQGLGYYTRARKLHECAKVLLEKYNGSFPQERSEMLKLPGIGPYAASSILAFAFNKSETVVDGNVIRVVSRLKGIESQVDKDNIYPLAMQMTPATDGADYASAIMDLGATVCSPQKPLCSICPWQKECVAYKKNLTDKIPLIKKPTKQNRYGVLYLIQNNKGEYYIRRRTEKGLLSGLYEFPWEYQEANNFVQEKQSISHTFTHFHLTLNIQIIKTETLAYSDGVFVKKEDLSLYPFSTLMRKAFKYL